MNIERVKVAGFSPTGTTMKVLEGIVAGIGWDKVEILDITLQECRRRYLRVNEKDLLVVGVPVYMGRVPALLENWLQSIQAQNTPVVCVVVYGNRAYEDALLELSDTLEQCGCITIAGAAFIGEHSFADEKFDVALGRPDEKDMAASSNFGMKIREKLEKIPVISEEARVTLPGNFPYGGITKLWDVDFIEVQEGCIQCGLCAEKCPTGAIDPKESSRINISECITCCSCIKVCPESVRKIKEGPVHDAQHRLYDNFREPKKAECFV